MVLKWRELRIYENGSTKHFACRNWIASVSCLSFSTYYMSEIFSAVEIVTWTEHGGEMESAWIYCLLYQYHFCVYQTPLCSAIGHSSYQDWMNMGMSEGWRQIEIDSNIGSEAKEKNVCMFIPKKVGGLRLQPSSTSSPPPAALRRNRRWWN